MDGATTSNGTARTPQLEPGAALVRVTTAVGERVLAARAQTGLTAAQLQVLRLASGGTTMSAIATGMAAPKSTVTSIVDQLVASGLAARRVDERDRRRQLVEPTRSGHSRLGRFNAAVADSVADLVQAVPSNERDRLRALLAKLPTASQQVPLG